MNHNVKIDFSTENLAVPEIKIADPEEKKEAEKQGGEAGEQEEEVRDENLAFPEYHVKKDKKN